MNKYLKQFVLAILAGFAISIGGIIYLTLENKIIGSLMFTAGLYTICLNGLFLFTGKVGYLVNESPSYLVTLLVTWLGNFAGTWIGAQMVLNTKLAGLGETAAKVSAGKVEQTILRVFLLGIFCGALMFIGLDGYKNSKNPLILFLCVSVFILAGFEHCIANMFYFSLGSAWDGTHFVYCLAATFGNAVGGCLIPLAKKMKDE